MSNNPFWEQQQNFIKAWNDNMSKFPGMEAFGDMYKNMIPDPSEYLKKMTEMVPNPTEYWNKMKDFMPNPTEYWSKFTEMMPVNDYWKNFSKFMPDSSLFKSMWGFKIPGTDIYEKVFDLWKNMGDPATFLKEYPEKYNDLIFDIFKSFLPDEIIGYFDKPKELMQTCVNFYREIFGPWMKIDNDILQRIMAGDIHAYLDFFRTFDDKYEETFSKVFNMMGMGLNREANEDQMKAVNSSIRMMFAVGELVALVIDSCGNSLSTLLDRYQEGLNDGKAVTTFHEFYDLWYKVTEEALLDLFNKDEFAKVFCDFADKSSQYMIALNKVYERMLSQLPIPTNEDMTSLYKTVYDLRKEIRDLHREIDGLKKAPAAQEK